MNRIHLRARVLTRRLQIFSVMATLIASLAIASAASASKTQGALILDPAAQSADPAAALSQYRAVGATTVRVLLKWYTVAPKANAKTAPKFSATNPGAYSAKLFSQYDQLISQAAAQGMKVDLDIMGGPPTWAQGKGAPAHFIQQHFGWEPNAKDFGQFVTAVAKRYSGHFKVRGQTLPKVSIFSLWNEPNFGQQVGPQQIRPTKKSANVLVSPLYYRNLLRSGYASLKKNAKGATILFGETAAHGKLSPKSGVGSSQVSISAPLPWLQTLYCLNSRYKHLTGAAGKAAGCTNLGSFKRQNPALFGASAYAAHPYASQFAPNVKASKVPAGDFILPVISRLTTALDTANKAWHSSKKFPIWSTEYGFVTNPPFKSSKPYPSPAKAAIYLNEAEYLSYKNPRVATYAQYLLNDPETIAHHGLFASGLRTSAGTPKPGYDAYRMPLWLPKQSVSASAQTEIWGGARPAVFGFMQDRTPQTVQIQEQTGGSAGAFTTIATETVSNINGDFDAHMKIPASGNLRLAYTYPADEPFLPVGLAGTTVFSRTVAVKVH
jgi:hypothetical protein